MAEGERQAGPAVDEVIAAMDWTGSPLGPPAEWSRALAATFAMVRRSEAQIVLFWGPEFAALYNDAYAPTIGIKHPDAFGQPARMYWSELWDDLGPLLQGVRDGGGTFSAKDRPFYIERHGFGETVWFDVSYSLVDDDDGTPGGVLCIVSETTARIRATNETRASEQRLRALVDASADFLFQISGDWAELRDLTGQTRLGHSTSGDGWRALIHADDLPALDARLAAAREHPQAVEFEHRLRGEDGQFRWVAGRIVPIFGEDGQVSEWFGAASDVTERHRAEARQQMLMHELEHRVCNTLAIVQSIAEQTFRDSGDVAGARQRFSARLSALAKANSLLTGDRGASASLAGAIGQALRVHQSDAARLLLGGPDLPIPARTALTLTLALHELATNATKYGAWANETGTVSVAWAVQGGAHGTPPGLRLEWRERGGPPVAKPVRRGFGSRLVERGLASELEGTVELRFEPEGLVCLVEAPLPEVERQA